MHEEFLSAKVADICAAYLDDFFEGWTTVPEWSIDNNGKLSITGITYSGKRLLAAYLCGVRNTLSSPSVVSTN